MIRIFFKELNGFLDSLIGYMVMGVFLVAIGLLTWVFPDTSVLDYGYADMDTLFSVGPFVLIFLIPAITMRSFAEEKKLGTLEWLLTKPVTEWSLVLGKFLASMALVTVSLLPTLIYYYSLRQLGNPIGNIDTPGIAGSYLGMILLSSVFCAVGVMGSALTANQIVSFILSAFLCLTFYTGLDTMAQLFSTGQQALWVKQMGMLYHYDAMSKGLIDTRDVVYFLSLTGVLLLGTRTILSGRSW